MQAEHIACGAGMPRGLNNGEKLNKKFQSNLGRAAPPPLIAENNYATKSSLVTVGCPTFTLILPLLLRRSPPPSNTPISRPTPLTTPNGIQVQSAVLPQYTIWTNRQTVRQTDWRTDGLGDKSVPSLAYALYTDYSDAAKTKNPISEVTVTDQETVESVLSEEKESTVEINCGKCIGFKPGVCACESYE